MKKLLLLTLLAFIVSGFATAQNSLSQWSTSEISQANTAKDLETLTEEEKKVIMLINLARLDGKKFKETFCKEYFVGPTNSYRQSLYADLIATKDLPMLKPINELCLCAKSHATEMGKLGKTGHFSANGESPFERMSKYGYWYGAAAENCSYGFSDAIGIVMQLLWDNGVPGTGHRKNILNSRYKAIGVSIQPHKVYSFNCVQDFGDSIPESD